MAGPGWFGLRSHPRPGGSVIFGGPDIPDWFDGALRRIVGPDVGAETTDSPSDADTETR